MIITVPEILINDVPFFDLILRTERTSLFRILIPSNRRIHPNIMLKARIKTQKNMSNICNDGNCL